jgi:hypothetical protein
MATRMDEQGSELERLTRTVAEGQVGHPGTGGVVMAGGGGSVSDLLNYIQFDAHRLPNQTKKLLQKN